MKTISIFYIVVFVWWFITDNLTEHSKTTK